MDFNSADADFEEQTGPKRKFSFVDVPEPGGPGKLEVTMHIPKPEGATGWFKHDVDTTVVFPRNSGGTIDYQHAVLKGTGKLISGAGANKVASDDVQSAVGAAARHYNEFVPKEKAKIADYLAKQKEAMERTERENANAAALEEARKAREQKEKAKLEADKAKGPKSDAAAGPHDVTVKDMVAGHDNIADGLNVSYGLGQSALSEKDKKEIDARAKKDAESIKEELQHRHGGTVEVTASAGADSSGFAHTGKADQGARNHQLAHRRAEGLSAYYVQKLKDYGVPATAIKQESGKPTTEIGLIEQKERTAGVHVRVKGGDPRVGHGM